MGLFDKKTCAVCGGQSGVIVGLFGADLAGGAYLCPGCRNKCTPGNLNFRNMTLDDVKANMAIAETNKKKGSTEFRSTRKIQTGAFRDKPFLDIDENHGWFMNTADNDGWVYSLDDIYFYGPEFETAKLELGQSFHLDTYNYPELSKCPEGIRITAAKLKILMVENELGVSQLSIDLLSGSSADENAVRGACAAIHDFAEAVKAYKTNRKK